MTLLNEKYDTQRGFAGAVRFPCCVRVCCESGWNQELRVSDQIPPFKKVFCSLRAALNVWNRAPLV